MYKRKRAPVHLLYHMSSMAAEIADLSRSLTLFSSFAWEFLNWQFISALTMIFEPDAGGSYL
jgi:hypothetical protein